MARPLVSAAVGDLKEAPAAAGAKGYKIGGRHHQPGCRCRACRCVRLKVRERRVRAALFSGGGAYVVDAAADSG